MPRYIDADALINEFDRTFLGNNPRGVIRATIENAPTIEPERNKGEWIVAEDGMIHCTVCEKIPTNKIMDRVKTLYYINPLNMNFCPSCGADMRGEQDD